MEVNLKDTWMKDPKMIARSMKDRYNAMKTDYQKLKRLVGIIRSNSSMDKFPPHGNSLFSKIYKIKNYELSGLREDEGERIKEVSNSSRQTVGLIILPANLLPRLHHCKQRS